MAREQARDEQKSPHRRQDDYYLERAKELRDPALVPLVELRGLGELPRIGDGDAALDGLLAACDGSRVILMGHSFGGKVVMSMIEQTKGVLPRRIRPAAMMRMRTLSAHQLCAALISPVSGSASDHNFSIL